MAGFSRHNIVSIQVFLNYVLHKILFFGVLLSVSDP